MTSMSAMTDTAAVLLAVCLFCVGDAVPKEDPGWISTSTTGFTEVQKKSLVDQHNNFRAMAGAGNMAKMTWDAALGSRAQAAADRCTLRHTPGHFRRTQSFHYAGENIKATTAKGFMVDTVVAGWWSEVKNYDLTSAQCSSGKTCGHYTQVMWATSYAVGCGVRHCDPIVGWGTNAGFVLFCLYGPGGNMGKKAPFVLGPPCSACPREAPYCEDQLCVNKPTLPLVDPNQHCREHKGNHSFMCLNPFFYHHKKPSGDSVCEALHCSVSKTRDRCDVVPGVDGLPCGVGKMCRDGTCQFDNSGATWNKTDSCLYGDQQQVLDWHEGRGRKIPCSVYLRHHGTGVCASEGVRQLCCESCAQARDPDHPDCPYGDQYAAWCNSMLSHHGRDWLCNYAPQGLTRACCGTCSSEYEDEHDEEDEDDHGDDDHHH